MKTRNKLGMKGEVYGAVFTIGRKGEKKEHLTKKPKRMGDKSFIKFCDQQVNVSKKDFQSNESKFDKFETRKFSAEYALLRWKE